MSGAIWKFIIGSKSTLCEPARCALVPHSIWHEATRFDRSNAEHHRGSTWTACQTKIIARHAEAQAKRHVRRSDQDGFSNCRVNMPGACKNPGVDAANWFFGWSRAICRPRCNLGLASARHIRWKIHRSCAGVWRVGFQALSRCEQPTRRVRSAWGRLTLPQTRCRRA